MDCVGFWDCTFYLFGLSAFRNCVVLVGVLVAVISVLSARSIARKKQSADLLFDSRDDKELVEGLRTLAKLHDDSGVNIRSFALKANVDTEAAKAIRYVLNHYEYVSVGVQSGIYDEAMLKEGSYNTVVRLYQRAKPYIESVREVNGRPTIYQEFQWLAKRWEEKPIGERKKRRWVFW